MHMKKDSLYIACIQLFQLRLRYTSKAEKSSAKSLLGVAIKNAQTEQNLVSRDTQGIPSRDLRIHS